MQKDFGKWHKIKSEVHENNAHHYYNERDVRWCIFGANIGFEIDGKGETFMRPVLVMKGFSRQTCLCIPVTLNKESSFYYPINLGDGLVRRVVLSQMKVIDTKRLTSLIGVVEKTEFIKVKEALIQIIK